MLLEPSLCDQPLLTDHCVLQGAFRSALIFLNGYFIGRNDNGYAPFRFDLSDFLRYGEKNYLVVRMDASFGDGWFYEGAGIYRHVWLTKTDALHMGQWESTVRAAVTADSTTLALGTVVVNEGMKAYIDTLKKDGKVEVLLK